MLAVRQPVLVPLPLPCLSGAEARRANLLAAANGTVTLTLGTTSVTLQLGRRTAGMDRLPSDWQADAELGGEPLSLWCSNATLSQLLRSFEPALVLHPSPPASILALLIDTLLHPLAPIWQRTLRENLVFVGIEACPTLSHLGVPIDITVAGQPHIAMLDGGNALDRILSLWPRQTHALSTLRFPAWLRLGSSELPKHILESLGLGDAVLVETNFVGRMNLHLAGDWKMATVTRGNTITVTESLGTVPHADTNIPPGNQGMTIDTLPVRLDFDVGHRELSLAELQTLQPGAILSLGRPATELVEIAVNGRRVGSGELVEVDGIPAVRITQLFGLG